MKTQQNTNQSDKSINYLGNQGQQSGGERAQGGIGGQDRSFGRDIPQGSSGISQGGSGGNAQGGSFEGERAQGGSFEGDEGSLDVEYLGNQAGLDGEVVGQAVTSDDDDLSGE